MSVDWPAQFGRTPADERSANRSFEVSLSDAFEDLEGELDRLGVDDFRYSFDADARQRDGRPYARARPDDPSFVLRWSMGGAQYAVACDRYSRLRDNVRTVGLYVREKRKMESRPVATGESEFANARLPSGDDVVEADPAPHTVLGVASDASEARIRDAYREKVKEVHPDNGGDPQAFHRVQRAKEVLLDE
ncbi:J domain-containing protein [Halobaculum sp. P14]|uniref:J domain-containing protein n=1 Tax=Halobaculum sp. P14 TaxID=3421638 RepID=UPI003EB96FE7